MDNNTDNMIGRRLDGRYELLELIGTVSYTHLTLPTNSLV